MNKTKIYLMIFIVLGVIFGIHNCIKATDLTPNLYLGIQEFREGTTPQNMAYAIKRPQDNKSTQESRQGYNIWKLVRYSSDNLADTTYDTSTSFYCIKASVGFAQDEPRATYNRSYDLVKDRDAIISTGNTTLQSIVGKNTNLINSMSQDKCYWGIIALADLIYVPESSTEQEKTDLLKKAGINNTSIPLKEDDIDAVQQAAFWYFTNYDETEGDVYGRIFNQYRKEEWLYYTTEDEQKINPDLKYHPLDDYDRKGGDELGEGEAREIQACILYDYLIKTALENIPKYQNGTMVSKNKITLYANSVDDNKSKASKQPVIKIEKYKPFDLALRKYITKVGNIVLKDGGMTREPEINEDLISTEGTAQYKHRKDPVIVKKGDTITYNITIYNEGTKAGRATKIVDQLPTGVKFSKINSTQYTTSYDQNTNTITFTRNDATNLEAYTEGNLDSETIEFECIVEQQPSFEREIILTNVAWIQEEYNAVDNQIIKDVEGEDRDSIPERIPQINGNRVNKDNMSDYKGTTNMTDLSQKIYYPGQEDDDDFEKLVIEKAKTFDLALRKFITKVENQTINTRIPQINYNEATKQITYTHPKEEAPVEVASGNVVTYTIRVFNEGEQNGYASRITDDLPEGLEYLPSHATNQTYRWKLLDRNGNETNSINEAVKITTDYLSKEQGEARKGGSAKNPALLEAFNPEAQISNTNPDYKDVQVAFKVTEENTSNRVVINSAQISDDTDENGNPIDDNDSKPDEWNEGEDDQDKEYIKVNYFDLALRKFIIAVSKSAEIKESDYLKETNGKYTREPIVDTSKLNTVGEDGKIIKTAIYKHPKNKITVNENDIVVYMLRVYNEAQIGGYATEITDYLPEGLEFVIGEFNTRYGWNYNEQNNSVTTTYLKDSIINGVTTDAQGNVQLSYQDVPIMCKIAGDVQSNTIKTNLAEITESSNDKDSPDRDSETSNLQVPTEEQKPTYNDDKTGEYIPGQEDDDDFEKVVVERTKIFDLALRKFITKVDNDIIDTRIPQITYNSENNRITYTHPKEEAPVEVVTGNIVTYTIRVFNEGEQNGYASRITDDIPEGLEFLPADETNQKYGWKMWDKDGNETDVVSNAVKITTEYLSKEEGEKRKGENAENPALLKAFNSEAQISDTNPDYKDVEVAFKVTESNTSDRIVVNSAQISKNTDENGDDIEDKDSTPDEWIEGEDDQDKEYIKLNYFDLALRKFIITVSKDVDVKESDYLKEANGKYTREPIVDTSKLNTVGEDGKIIKTAIYKHPKGAVTVAKNDIVIYMLRVYNEAQISGYATEITDYLPEGLEFVNGEFNTKYGWNYNEQTRVATTQYLKDTIINGAEVNDQGVLQLDYKEVPIMCKINESAKSDTIHTNLAEIIEDKNDKNVPDRDSNPDNLEVPPEEEKPTYNDDKTGEYIPGQEDDDDFEKIVIEPTKKFDLALRKFISKVEKQEILSRIPQVNYDKQNDKITYEHSKEPVEVITGNTIIYTIRVFNEGEIDGYASKITDDIPEGLEFLPDDKTNQEYRWKMLDSTGNETTDVSNAVKVTTDYLSKEQGEARKEEEEENPALLKAFDSEAEISETNPDNKDVEIAFKVVETNKSDKVIINSAQISEHTDKDGNEVEDKDSTPDEWNEGEDDQDREYIKLTYFDLSLKKWVTQTIVIENGKETVTQTGHTPDQNPEPIVKVEIHRNKLNAVTVKFRFAIRVTNEGDISGYAKEITDYIPEGLRFVAEDNPGWTDTGNNMVTTNLLSDKLLQPGESADVDILLTWINGSSNMGLKTNIAEITKDYNDKGAPDIDSIPGNKKLGEDDIDEAPVMLSIKTGKMQTYIMLGLSSMITMAGGIIVIKRYVL